MLDWCMAKIMVPPDILLAINAANEKVKEPSLPNRAKRKEADPKSGATEKQSIRPARTAIAHVRGGNKGK